MQIILQVYINIWTEFHPKMLFFISKVKFAIKSLLIPWSFCLTQD